MPPTPRAALTLYTCLLTTFYSPTPFDICFPGCSGNFWPERLENVTPNFLQPQLHFLLHSRPGLGALLLSRGPGPGRPMGARRPLLAPPPPPPPPSRDLALRGGEAAKKFLLRVQGASARRRCSPCNSAAGRPSLRFPSRCSGARKGSAVESKRKEFPWERERRARTRGPAGARASPSAGSSCGAPSARRRRSAGPGERPRDRDGRAEGPGARGGAGAAAVRGVGARGPGRGHQPSGRRRAPVPRSLPLPRRPAGLQSPAPGAPSRAAPALGRSAVSILPEGGGGKPAAGLGTGRAAAFSRAAALGPGLERRSVGMERSHRGTRSPFPCALRAALGGGEGGGGRPRCTRLASLGRGEGATDNSGG